MTIVLIGHEGHDEVIGTMGEAPEAIILVETPDDVDRVQVADPHKIAYLTQTTLSVDDANRIIARLREKFPAHSGAAQGRYLLRDTEPAGSSPPVDSGRRPRAGRRQPKQFQ